MLRPEGRKQEDRADVGAEGTKDPESSVNHYSQLSIWSPIYTLLYNYNYSMLYRKQIPDWKLMELY